MRLPAMITLALLLLTLLSPGPAQASDAVQVAVVGPLVGTSYSIGMQYKVGVTAALSTLPDGCLLQRPVAVTFYDDSCDRSLAEAVAQEVVETSPAVVIGHSCSGPTIAAAPIYARHKVLQITPASTNPKVTAMGIGTIFRMIGQDAVQGRLAARLLAERHGRQRIGFVYFPGAYSEGLAKTALDALAERGITPVATLLAQPSKPSYADKIEELLNHKVETLYLVGGGLDCAIFMRQARQMGAAFTVIGGDTLVSDVFVKTAGEAANGVLFTFPPNPAQLPSAAQAAAAVRASGHEPEGYTLLAYAAAQVWIEGVTRAQSFEADMVADALRGGPMRTILGMVSFDPAGDIVTPYEPFTWCAWSDGKIVPRQ